MAETPSPNNAEAGATEAAAPQVRVLAQYIKDLSFENPGAPDALRAGAANPAIDMGIDVQARRHGEAFEVTLHVEAKAKREEAVAFIVELKYAGMFQFLNIPENALEQMLLIEAPRMLFPFARNVLAEVTRDGGFPPLFLDPIDFGGLYLSQKRQAEAQAGGASGDEISQA